MSRKLISHRGNLYASDYSGNPFENTPDYIDNAIRRGFDVEIDVRVNKGIIFLGHDTMITPIPLQYLRDRYEYLWIHLKNHEAVNFFLNSVEQSLYNYFWHEDDTLSITSKGYIWTSDWASVTGGLKTILMSSAYNNPVESGIDPINLFTLLKKYDGICSDNIVGVQDGFDRFGN